MADRTTADEEVDVRLCDRHRSQSAFCILWKPCAHPTTPTCRPTCGPSRRRSRATRATYGLDFYETIFEVVDADDLNEIAAYGGFPTRYPHWSFGMAYEELRRATTYGLSKIYEMVINNDPCYAYLMRCNHVGRSEAGDGPRLRALRLLQEQRLLRPHQPQDDGRDGQPRRAHPPLRREVRRGRGRDVRRPLHVDRRPDRRPLGRHQAPRGAARATTSAPSRRTTRRSSATRFKSKDYMDDYINPRDVLKAEEEERRS